MHGLARAMSRAPLHGVIVGLALLWTVPTLALFVNSFRTRQDINASGWWNAFTDLSLTFSNYTNVLDQENMARSFLNSIIITVPSTVMVILVAAFAAYAFAWMSFRGRNLFFMIVVALLVVPIQATLIPVFRLLTDLNLIGEFWGLWLAHTAYGLPFAIFLLRNFFGALPRELLESAYLDGASDLRVFFRLLLPLSVPALAALAIFQFMWVWNDLLVALIFLGDPDKAPMTLTISNLVGRFASDKHLLTSAAFISMALPLFIFFALQRYFVQGILAGSVKG